MKRNRIVQADTEDGQIAGEAIIETVENQIRDNDPPEAREALERLMANGESRDNAMRYVASAMATEIFNVMNEEQPFNLARYVGYLEELPELPDGSDPSQGKQ